MAETTQTPGGTPQTHTLSASGEEVLTLPEGLSLSEAEFAIDGSDLVLTFPDGTSVTVENYYEQPQPPQLASGDGANLSGDMVVQLTGTPETNNEAAIQQFADAAGAQVIGGTDGAPIGTVKTLSGEVWVTRADGTRVQLQAGDEVFQGDNIETGPDGAIGVLLADETTFSMGEDSAMVLDEMIYDPATQDGSLNVSVVQGVFTFVSGQVAKTDPDAMKIDTPVATIGIRGTQVGIEIPPDGEMQVVLMQEADGFVGEVVIENNTGQVVMNQGGDFVSIPSYDSEATNRGTLSDDDIVERHATTLKHLPVESTGGDRTSGNHFGLQEEIEQGANEQDDQPTPEELAETETAAGTEEQQTETDNQVADNSDQPSAEDLQDFQTDAGGDGFGEDFTNVTDEIDPFAPGTQDTGLGDQEFQNQNNTQQNNDPSTPEDDTEDEELIIGDGATVTAGARAGGEDNAIPLNLTINKNDPNDTLSVTLTGIPDGSVLSGGGGQITVAGGTATLSEAQLAGLNITPPENYSGSFNVGVSATTSEGGNTSAATTGTLTVNVTGVADEPTLTMAVGNEAGGIIPLTITATTPDTDGSETVTVTISDIPVGAVLNLGGGTTFVATENNTSIDLSPDQLTGLTIVPVGEDLFNLTVTATTTEQDGDSFTTAPQALPIDPSDVANGATIDLTPALGDEDTAISLGITVNKADPDETAEITLSGIPEGAVLSNANGPITVTDGVAVLSEEDLVGLQVLPPVNSDVDFPINVSVVTTDGTSTSEPATGTITVGVNGVADAPTLDVGTGLFEGTGFRGDAIPVDISAALTDTDGSETLSVSISGLPAGATLSAGTYDQATDSWTLTPEQLDDLSVSVGDDWDTDLELTVTATSTEAENGDTATTTTTIGVDINRDVLSDLDDVFTMDEDSVVYAGDGDDVITTTVDDDVVFGEEGDDTFIGGLGGSDAFIGGAGTDTVDYSALDANSPLYVNLTDDPGASGVAVPLFDFDNDGDLDADDAAAIANSGNYDYDALNGIEDVIGGAGNDIIVGSDGANVLVGGLGDDILAGGGGDDRIVGGDGVDTAVFEDNFEEFTVNLDSASGELSVGGSSIDGNDTLVDVEVLQFGDLTITVSDLLDAVEPVLDVASVIPNTTEDVAVALPISASLDASVAEGTETLSVTLSGIPEGAVLSAGGSELTVVNGEITFEDGVVPADLMILPPANSATDFNITVTATSTSVATEDGVADTATTTTTLAVTVLPDAVAPIITPVTGEALSFVEDAGAIDLSSLFSAEAVEPGEVVASFTIGGLPAGATLSGNVTDNGDGTYTIAAEDLGDVQLGLPDDFDLNFSLEVSATSLQVDPDDPDNQDLWSYETSDAVEVPLNIIAQADAPTVNVGTAFGLEDGGAIGLTIDPQAAAQDINGEVVSVTISDLPLGATLSAGTVNEDGSVTLTPEELEGLTISLPEDFDLDFSLSVTATAQETDPDTGEVTTATSDPVSLDVGVGAVADTPTVNVGTAFGLEDGGAIGLTIDPQAAAQDINGEVVSVTVSGIPAGAALSAGTVNEDGSVMLTPAELEGLTISLPEDFDLDFSLSVTATAQETDPDTGAVTTATSDPVSLDVGVGAVADAPTVNVGVGSGDEDTAIALTIDPQAAAQDINGEVTSITISGIPAGATLSAGTVNEDGSVTLTPAELEGLTITPSLNSGADFQLSVTATAQETDPDTGAVTTATSDPVTLDVLVDAVADAPDLVVNNVEGLEDVLLPLDLTASLSDTDGSETLSVTIDGIPLGAVLSNDDGPITLTGGSVTLTPDQLSGLSILPPLNSSDDFDLTVTATSTDTDPDTGATSTATTTGTINVDLSPDADAPVLVLNDAVGDEDTGIALDIQATLPDSGEVLTVTISDIPEGATLTMTNALGIEVPVPVVNGTATIPQGALGGDLTITPPADSDADFDLTVTATSLDGTSVATTEGTLSVTVNAVADAPTLNVDATESGVEDGGAIALDISSSLTDTDGSETLSISISGVPEGATLSAGSYDQATDTWTLTPAELSGLTVTPAADSGEDFQLTVTATSTEDENGDTATQTATIDVSVASQADAPTVETTAASGLEDGGAISLDIDPSAAAQDVNGEIVSVTVSGIPAGATLSAGTVNDDGSVTLTPDELDGLTISLPEDFDTDFNLSVTATAEETDPDTGEKTSATSAPVDLPVSVIAQADAPTVETTAASGLEDGGAIALDIDPAAAAEDINGVVTEVTISGIPAGATLSAGTVNDDGSVTLTPEELDGLTISLPEDFDTDFNLSVTATAEETDPETGEKTSATSAPVDLPVSVIAQADAPTVETTAASGLEDGGAIALDIDPAAATEDINGEVVSVTVSGIPAGATLSAGTVNDDGSVTLTPEELDGLTISLPEDFDTDFNLSVTATAEETDPETGEKTSATSAPVDLPVSVIAQADAPDVTVGAASGDEDTAIALTIDADAAAEDINGEVTSISISGVPAGATLSAGSYDQTTDTWTLTPDQLEGLTITPPTDSGEDFQLSVTATAQETDPDTGEVTTATSDPVTLNVTVDAVADAPDLDLQSTVTGDEDTAIPLDISAGLTDTDGSEVLSVTITGVPQGATLSAGSYDQATDTWTLSASDLDGLTVTPALNDDTDFTLNVTATSTDTDPDTGATTTATSSGSMFVDVDAVADAPILVLNDVAGDEDTAIPLDITATLQDGAEVLSLSISGIPDGSVLTVTNPAGNPVEVEVVGGVAQIPNGLVGGDIAITPPQDSADDFQLTVTATSNDNGDIATTTGTMQVTVQGVADGATVTDTQTTGVEDQLIPLNVNVTENDIDGSETLSVTLSNIPQGAVIMRNGEPVAVNSDGTVNLGEGELDGLAVLPPADFSGNFDITVSASTTDEGDQSDVSLGTISVSVLGDADGATVDDLNVSTVEDTAIGLPISIDKADDSETAEITLSGIPEGAVLANDNGPIDVTGGTVTLSEADLAGLQITPPTDSDVDFDIGVSVVTKDGESVSGSTSGTISVDVDGIADVPNLTVSTGQAEGNETPLNIDAAVADINAAGAGNEDGEETIQSITISDIPPGAKLMLNGEEVTLTPLYEDENGNLVEDLGDLIGDVVGGVIGGGQGETPEPASFTVTFAGDVDLSDLTIISPVGSDDAYDLTITAVSEEDGTTAENTATLTVTPPDYADGAEVSDLDVTTDEDMAIALPINIEKADESETAEITLSGIPQGAVLSNDSGPVTVVDGVAVLSEADLAGLQITPPANSDVDFDLGVSVVTTDGTDTSDPATATISVDVDGVADVPTLEVSSASGIEDAGPIALDISSALTDADGSETLSISISGVPEGATLSAGSYDEATDTWTLTPAELTGLSVTPAADSGEDFQLTVTSTSTEGENGDTATNTATIDVSVASQADAPDVTVEAASGAEDGAPIALNIDADAAAGDLNGDVTSITISGVPAGATLSSGTYDEASDSWTLLPSDLDGLTVDLPADFDEDFSLSVTATAVEFDPDTQEATYATSTPVDLPVSVIAQADAPTVETTDASVTEDTGDIPLDIDVAAAAQDINGEVTSVTISGVPAGATLSAGSYDAATDSWTLDPADLDGLTVSVPENYSEDFTLSVSATAQETDPDTGEVTTETSEPAPLNVAIAAVADAPTVTTEAAVGDEDTAIALNIDADAAAEDLNGEVTSITISGVPAGATLSAGSFDQATGNWTLTPAELEGLTITPVVDSADDFVLTVTATAQETDPETGAVTTATSDPVSLDVTVQGVADGADVTDTVASGAEDTAIPLTIDVTELDTDGSETLSVTLSNIPEGAVLTRNGQPLEVVNGEITLAEGELDGITILPPQDFSGAFDIAVSATTTDEGDVSEAATGTISVNVDGDADGATLTLGAAGGDEDTFIDLPISIDKADADETAEITLSGIPQGAVLVNDNGPVSVVGGIAVLTEADLAGLQIKAPEDSGVDFNLDVSVVTTDGTSTSDPATGTINVGVDAVADVPQLTVGSAASGSEDSAIPLNITAGLNDEDGSEVLSVTISDVPPGATLTMANGDSFTATEENTTFLFTADDLAGMTITPPENSDDDFTLNVIATSLDTDPDTGAVTTASAQGSIAVSVDPEADAPTLVLENAQGDEDSAIALDIDAGLTDESEVLSVTISDIPVGAKITLTNGTEFVASEGNTSFDLGPNDLEGVTITPPENSNEDITLQVTATSTESDGTTATTSSPLVVDVIGVADAPTLTVTLGEGTLSGGGSGATEGYVGDGSDLVNQFVDDGSNTHTAGGGDDVWVVNRDLNMNENFIMGGGDDTLVINGDVPGGVNIVLGGHNDSVTINGDITGNVSINGSGQTNDGGDTLYLGKGQDSYQFQNYTIQPNGMINTQIIDLDTGQTMTINNIEAIAFDDGTFVGNGDLVQFQTPGGGDQVVEYPLDITAGLTDLDGSETLSATISGVPAGATLTLADGTVLTSTDVNDPIEIPVGQLEGITLSVEPETDFNLTVTATSTENDGHSTSVSANVSAGGEDVLAEAPELTLSDAAGNEDAVIPLDISAALTDTDGSESLSITIGGVPDGAVLRSGDTVLQTTNGEITFADGVIPENLTIQAPANSGSDFPLTVSATSTESSSGDTNTIHSTLNVAVAADADAPTLTVDLGDGTPTGGEGGTDPVPGSVTIENVAQGSAGYHNTYGYYIKGEDGTPQSGEIVWGDVKDSVGDSFTIDGVDPADIGFFIIPNGDSLNNVSDGMDVTFTQGQDGNWHVVGPNGQVLSGQGDPVLFSDPALNENNFDYTQDTSQPGNQNWEDLAGGGDNDFNDININITSVDPVPGTPGTGDAVVEYPLNILSELQDTDGSETLSATISGLPAGASLTLADGTVLTSTDVGDVFDLTDAQLTGITLSVPQGEEDFDLSVSATATDTDPDTGVTDTATVNTTVSVDVPEIEGPDLTVSDAQGDEDTAITLNIAAAFEGAGGGGEVTGSFYLLEEGSDSIVRINLDGTAEEVVTQEDIKAATGEDDADFDNQGVATDADGNIFFTELESESLLMAPADGGPVQVIASESAIRAATGEDDADLAGMTIGSDGMIYMVDDESDSLLRVDPATGAVTVAASESELEALGGISGVDLEGGIVASDDGKLHFVSAGDPQAVFTYDIATGEPTVLAKSDDCEWHDLDGYITLTPDGDVVIVDETWDGSSSQDAIYIIDADTGESQLLVSNAQLRAAAGGEVDLEGGISFDADGNLYVAEEKTDTIYKFDADGNGGVDGDSGSVFVSKSDLSDLVGRDADLEGGMFFAQMITEGGSDLSITVSGIPEGATLTMPDGSTFTATEGNTSYDLDASDLEGLTITPPQDSDEDFSLTITATGTTANGQEVSSTASLAVTVDAVADAPNVTAQDADGEEDTPIDLDITAELTDLDGSESITSITISGVPAGATLNNGSYDAASDTWTLEPTDLVGLQVNPATNSNEDFQLTITATSMEADGGHTAVGSVTMDVNVAGVVDEFTVTTENATADAGTTVDLDIGVDLTDLDGSETVSVTISGIPEGASLNNGQQNPDGSWTLEGGELEGLTITLPETSSGAGGGVPQTLYSQNFDNLSDGSTSAGGDNGFSTDASQADYESHGVAYDAYTFSKTDSDAWDGDEAVMQWNSAPIDISGQEDVSFTFDLKGYGSLDTTGNYNDYITVIAVVDGVEHELMVDDSGAHDWQNFTFNDLPQGEELIIRMEAKLTATDEVYKIDNLEVAGTPAAAEPLEDFQLTVETTVTESDGASETVTDYLDVTVNQDTEASAPTLTVTPASGDEDTIIDLDVSAALTDTDGSESLSVTISGIPAGATLYSGATELTVTNGEITFADGVIPADLGIKPPANSDGDFSLTVTATSTEENGGATNTMTTTIDVTVDAVADVPVITSVSIGEPIITEGSDGVMTPVVINSTNFGETDTGFTVSARTVNSDGSLSEASEDNVSTNGSPLGFGVAGSASGADSELGYNSAHNVSEQLIVDFDQDVSSVDVSFAWMHAGEQATFTLYRDGVAVGTGTVNGVTDAIDPPVTLSTTDGGTFDQIVFTAPDDDDDFLINSISFETGSGATQDVAEYPIDVSASLADIDGSEDLSVTIGGVPEGATLSAGSDNGDGTWTVGGGDFADLTMSVPFEDELEAFDLSFTATATESDGGSTASSQAVTATAPAVEADAPAADVGVAAAISEGEMNEDGDAIVYDLDITPTVDGQPAGEDATITVSGIPAGVTLSAGTNNGDGTYTLAPAQLSGLQVLVSDAVTTDFSMSVTATLGDQTSVSDDVLAEVDPSLFLEVDEDSVDNDHLVANDGSADDRTGDYREEDMYGSRKNDDLESGGGGGTMYGGAGKDDLTGSWGEDTLYGGSGDDDLVGGSQDDVLYGGSGKDDLEGDSGADTLYGGSGNDDIEGGSQDDLIYGGSGNDDIDAGSDNDTVYGGTGNDDIDAGSGHDYVHGGAGDDEIFGDHGDDTIVGGSGDDSIDGGTGNDALFGGLGDDFIEGGYGDDVIFGGAGNDTLEGGGGADTFIFDADSGHDIIEDIMMQDTLEFQGEQFDMNDMIFSENEDGDAVISFAGKDDQSVTLKGVKYDDLDTNGDGDASEGYSVTQTDDGFSVNIDDT